MTEQTFRAVFDCNVFLQGIANRNSPARKTLRLFFDRTISLFVSAEILREVKDVLNRPELRLKLPGINDRIVNALFTKIESQSILIKNVPEEYRLDRDPDDEMYINLAIVTNAQFLVSKDKDLLDLMTATNEIASRFRLRYSFLRIVNAAEFVKEIELQMQNS